MTVARKLANHVKAFGYDRLSGEVVHQTKRILIDALGCCIGAFKAEATQIVHDLIKDLGGPEESTVIGSGLRTGCLNAAVVNGVMVRYLDYNDLYAVPAGKWYVGVHPSDAIPGILAVGERMKCSGKSLIATIVLSYELSARFCYSATNPPLSKLGWNEDTRGVYIMPLVAGKLLELTEEQLENAVGISGCHGMILGILDTAAEEYSMTKNMRFPFTAHGGILAALLAKRGFTGPTTVIEGNEGFNETLMKGSFDVETFTTFEDRFYIMDTGFKALCAVGAVQGHLNATVQLVNQYDIEPEDVDRVRVTAGTRPIEHTGDPAKKYPTNKETADHSSYFLTAIAIVDRTVGPEQYQPSKYNDPRVLQLIDKITLEIDPEMDKLPRSGMSEIVTKDGKSYTARIDYPKGHPKNPMSDHELEAKFKSMASKYMTNIRMEKIIQMIYQLENLQDIGDLMKELIFDQ
jgi:2-methylcitrate dehydratase